MKEIELSNFDENRFFCFSSLDWSNEKTEWGLIEYFDLQVLYFSRESIKQSGKISAYSWLQTSDTGVGREGIREFVAGDQRGPKSLLRVARSRY